MQRDIFVVLCCIVLYMYCNVLCCVVLVFCSLSSDLLSFILLIFVVYNILL